MTDDPPIDRDPTLGFTVVIGLLEIDLRLHGCRSLKMKRGILARALKQLRRDHALSAAEIAYQDVHDRAGLAAVIVNSDPETARNCLRAAAEGLRHIRELELVDYTVELL